jgi:hypothetical protein
LYVTEKAFSVRRYETRGRVLGPAAMSASWQQIVGCHPLIRPKERPLFCGSALLAFRMLRETHPELSSLEARQLVQYGNIETGIFTAEHLCAIALDTGRMKDFYRVASFIEQGKVERLVLNQLVIRYKLENRTKNVLNSSSDEDQQNQP